MVSLTLTLSFLTGCALLAYGTWLAWEPGGFLVGGGELVLVPFLYVRGRWVSSTGS